MSDSDEDKTGVKLEDLGDTANAVVEFLIQKKLTVCDIMIVLIMAHVTVWKNTRDKADEAKELKAYVGTFKKISTFVDKFCSFEYEDIKPTQ